MDLQNRVIHGGSEPIAVLATKRFDEDSCDHLFYEGGSANQLVPLLIENGPSPLQLEDNEEQK